MYQAIGLITKEVYATGGKADCLRKLHHDYPTHEKEIYNRPGATATIKTIFPEVIVLRKTKE